MKHARKTTLLAALLTGAWLPTTIVCDVPDLDIVVRGEDYGWDGFFEDIFVFDGYERHHCGDGFFFDWFGCW